MILKVRLNIIIIIKYIFVFIFILYLDSYRAIDNMVDYINNEIMEGNMVMTACY